MCGARPPGHYTCDQHVGVTYDLGVDGMHIFSIHIDVFIHRWCPYQYVGAVNGSNHIGETGHCCKWPFGVGLLLHSVRESDVPIIPVTCSEGWGWGGTDSQV